MELESPTRIKQKGFDPEMFTSERTIRKASTSKGFSSPRRTITANRRRLQHAATLRQGASSIQDSFCTEDSSFLDEDVMFNSPSPHRNGHVIKMDQFLSPKKG